MKLSAPPPPPPPPPEPPAPGGQPDPNTPNNTGAEAPAAQPPETPEAPPAPAAPGPKPLRWPAWFPGVDAAIVGLVLVFTFLAASFVARNSDVWLHLASGQRLFAGYTPGSDPFSYSAADRPWVNHSWLLDAVVYRLYGGAGVLLVVAKALVVALAFGLLIAIRRPQFALWPWAAVACVAVLAAAPQFTLRPLVMSILFLSVTMYLLFRFPRKEDPKQFLIAIGVTFWLWANCDHWFFLGPLALALLVLGDLIQTKLLNSPDEPLAEGSEEPLGRLPDTLTLAKALGVGVLACMLNPHHVRVWELPLELTKPSGLEGDPRLQQLLVAPTDSLFWENAGFGSNINGVAYAVLFLGGAVALGFGPGRVRIAHIALFVGFAALSLLSIFAIPFFAVVAVPLLASQLNALGALAELKTWADPRSRLLYIGSALARIVGILAVCALCVIAYPGWVHPDAPSPVFARRVAWGVEPEPALARAAEQFKEWRESGKLPSDARGIVTNFDLANYLAWYAPQEKVFVNSRYNHHLPEFADYLAARKGLGLVDLKDEPLRRADLTDVLRKTNAEYVAISAAPWEVGVWKRSGPATMTLYNEPAEWAPWYLDGRTTVFGWRPAGAPSGPAFAALRVDPVVSAFGPGVKPLEEKPLQQPLAPLGWEEPFVHVAKPTPAGALEALGWMRFKNGIQQRQQRRQVIRERLVLPWFFGAPATAGTWHAAGVQWAAATGAITVLPFDYKDGGPIGAAADEAALRAVPVLALRAARRAIIENPDHPDGYFILAQVLTDSDLPLLEGERALGRVIALRQCLSRMPRPDRYKRGQFLGSATEVSLQLADMYLGQPLDPPDATGRRVVRGFTGVPIDVAPLRDRLGQAVVMDLKKPQAPLERVPFELIQGRALPPNIRVITGNTPCFLSLDLARETVVQALEYLPLDTAGEPPDVAKKNNETLEGYRKDIDAALVLANDRYDVAQKARQDLPTLVEVARLNGLTGEAIRLLSDKDAVTKEYKDRASMAATLWVSLVLATGRIEDAAELLKDMEAPEWTTAIEKTGLTATVRLLRYQKAIHAGEFKTAGEIWETIAGRVVNVAVKQPPLGPTVPRSDVVTMIGLARGAQSGPEAEKAMLAMLVPTLVPMGPMVRETVMEAWRGEWGAVAGALRGQIIELLSAEARYYSRRGTLALLEGDIPNAKRWYKQEVRVPPGWNFPNPQFVLVDAQQYLRYIETAERKAAAR